MVSQKNPIKRLLPSHEEYKCAEKKPNNLKRWLVISLKDLKKIVFTLKKKKKRKQGAKFCTLDMSFHVHNNFAIAGGTQRGSLNPFV